MSIHLQGSHPLQGLCGVDQEGYVNNVYDIFCIRKNVHNLKDQKNYEGLPKTPGNPKHCFTMYSTPKMYKCQFAIQNASFWCHPFREEVKNKYVPEHMPSYLMSESDFIDRLIVPVKDNNINNKKNYDFFYITYNNAHGFTSKGFAEFIEALKVLCLEKGLRGKVLSCVPKNIKYWKLDMTREQKKILKDADPFLETHWGWKTSKFLNNFMSDCKFGFFPNIVDCSPRILTECLVRDVPIIVNKNIWGGWKYVNDRTGRIFDPNCPDSLRSAVDDIINNQKSFSPSASFMNEYGFRESSKRLAEYINYHIRDTGCKYIYFIGYKKIFKKMIRQMKNT